MKRKEILDSMPELPSDDFDAEALRNEFADWMTSVLNHYEIRFQEIRDKLDINSIDDLGQLSEAADIACNCADDLY